MLARRHLGGHPRTPGLVLLAVASVAWIFFAPNYWVFTGCGAIILTIHALGLWVLVGWAREMSLSQAAVLGTAVYVMGWLYRPDNDGKGWPFVVAAVATVVLVAVLQGAVSLVSLRLSGVYVMVLTLGLQFTLERVVFSKGVLTGGVAPYINPRPWFFGIDLSTDRSIYLFLLGFLAVVLVLLARLRASRYGRALLLVGSNRRAAAALGVSPWRYKMFAFAICGALAGLAGVLSAPLYEAPPQSFNYSAVQSLFFLAIPVLAGVESLLAVVVVSVLFTVLPQALESWRISAPLLGGFGLVGGTLLGSRGIGGTVLDQWRRLKRREWRARGSAEPVIRISAGAEAGSNPLLESVEVGGDYELDERRAGALAVLEAYLPARYEGDVTLTATGISVAFGGVQALQDASITVPTGALVGLIGPNGAGKSTMFDVVNGLRLPDAGRVELFGRDVTALRAWDRAALGMSRTFQANHINLDQSVRDNLLAGAYTTTPGSLPGVLLGLPGSWAGMRRAEEAARAVAELLDIDRHWDERPAALSFGNRRRVEIGRSILAGPRLLLLDEPAAGLDPRAAAILFALVKRLHRDLGLTVLLVEHDVRAVLQTCDLVYVLAQGQLAASGTPAEVAHHPDVRSQYLGIDFNLSGLSLR